jgi:Carboxypeptidase regulatory-like domain
MWLILCNLRRRIPHAVTLASLVLGIAAALHAQSSDVEAGATVQVESTPSPAQDDSNAPQPGPPATASTDGKFTLSGTVVNSVTGEPVRRALVQMNGRFEASVLTDFEGAFKFEGVAPGTTYLSVRKPGFFTEQELNSSDPGPPVSVEVGPNSSATVLKLVPEGTISGKVIGGDGLPVEDLPVVVFVQRIMEGLKHRVQQNRTTTDSDGHFKIANLQPGTYFLATGPGTGFSRRRRQPRQPAPSRDEGYPQVFYPASTELTSAAPILVSAGQDSEADFSVKTEQMYRVSGTVAGFAPGMSLGMQVQSKSGEYLPVRHFLNPRTGEFRAQLLAGSYRLHLNAQTEGQMLTADVPLTVNSDIADLPIVMAPTVDIPVVIRTEGGNSASGNSEGGGAGSDGNVRIARIRASSMQQASVRLSAGDTFSGGRDFWSSPGDDPKNPSFAVHNVEPGTYSVDINANGAWYVQSASCGETDLLRDDLRVSPGAHLPPIQITLRGDPGTITGSVQTGGHASKAGVLLIPDRGGAGKVQSTSTGQDGEFQFSMLAPGDYRILAFDHIDRLEYRNPDVLESYLSRANRVTVQASEQAKATVEMIVTGQ